MINTLENTGGGGGGGGGGGAMPPRAATAAAEAAAAVLPLEIAAEFSRVRSLRLTVTLRRVDDARAVLGISDTAHARTTGRQKQKFVRKACWDDVAVLRYTPEVEYMRGS